MTAFENEIIEWLASFISFEEHIFFSSAADFFEGPKSPPMNTIGQEVCSSAYIKDEYLIIWE